MSYKMCVQPVQVQSEYKNVRMQTEHCANNNKNCDVQYVLCNQNTKLNMFSQTE